MVTMAVETACERQVELENRPDTKNGPCVFLSLSTDCSRVSLRLTKVLRSENPFSLPLDTAELKYTPLWTLSLRETLHLKFMVSGWS